MEPYNHWYVIGFYVVLFLVILSIITILTVIFVPTIREAILWRTSGRKPVLTIHAVVAGRRTRIMGGQHKQKSKIEKNPTLIKTLYYATFQLENGEVKELRISDKEYYSLEKGEEGNLTYQGARFIYFV